MPDGIVRAAGGRRPGGGARALLLAIVAGGAAAVLGACSSTGAFHRHYEAGRLKDAVASFRADSALHDDPDALFRMALAQSAPGSPAHDLEAARARLRRLIDLHPDTGRSRDARLLLAVLEELQAVRTQLQKMKEVDLDREPQDGPRRPR